MPGTNVPVAAGFDTTNEASTEAKNLYHNHKKKEYKSTLLLVGLLVWPGPKGVPIQAGVNATFANKGIYNGLWILEAVKHNLSGGKLDTELEWRKCIDPADIPPKPAVAPAPPEDDSTDPTTTDDPDPDPNPDYPDADPS
jgi:hypothetical protein